MNERIRRLHKLDRSRSASETCGGQCNPLPVSVDGLRLPDASARDGAVRGRLSRLQMLPTGDSYFN